MAMGSLFTDAVCLPCSIKVVLPFSRAALDFISAADGFRAADRNAVLQCHALYLSRWLDFAS